MTTDANETSDNTYLRKPPWLKVALNTNESFQFLKHLTHENRLHTVCEEARCPNIHECWSEHQTATFMILGDTCTRRCRFCSVKTGIPQKIDIQEPMRVAHAVHTMDLRHVVITMVNRDDLLDGGASVMAQTVEAIHTQVVHCMVEVLSSDLLGDPHSIEIIMRSIPDIISHNIETVRRLTPYVRSRSHYDRSLRFLRIAKEYDTSGFSKSSIMIGLGETMDEIQKTLDDLRAVGVDMVNIGQYLQPSRQHLPVQKYWTPDEFVNIKEIAYTKGFSHVESGTLVRSSYHAGTQFKTMKERETHKDTESYEKRRKQIHPLYRDV